MCDLCHTAKTRKMDKSDLGYVKEATLRLCWGLGYIYNLGYVTAVTVWVEERDLVNVWPM